jgi:hypothetical protein
VLTAPRSRLSARRRRTIRRRALSPASDPRRNATPTSRSAKQTRRRLFFTTRRILRSPARSSRARSPSAPPDAIPLEALERAFAETAAETAAVEKEKGDAEDASGRTTRAQTTEKPFRWDDEAEEKNGEKRDEDAPLPPLPWDKRADASTPDGDAWTPAPDPRINRDPSPDKSSRISKVDDCRHTSVIDALREALRLERDARDAAVRAAVAVARERDFDALREMAETVASHCSARVAFDVEARIAHDAEEASERHADLERRLFEVTRENAKHEATNASLAEQAERLERRLDATERGASRSKARRRGWRVSSSFMESSRVESRPPSRRVSTKT